MEDVLMLERILSRPECATAAVELKGNVLVVRPLQEDDGVRMAAYFDGLSARTRGWFAPHKFDAETAQALCRDRLSPSAEGGVRMVAVTSTAPPSIAAYFIFLLGVRAEDRTRFASYGLALNGETDCTLAPSVADAFQGVGLGSAMLRHVVEIALRAGRTRMVLLGGVNADNLGAVHFYEKFGFRTVAAFGTATRKYDMIMNVTT